MNTIAIIDQTIGGERTHVIEVRFDSDEITLRDLITQRVLKDVEEYNSKVKKSFLGLVTPTKDEILLNSDRLKNKKDTIDAEKQIYIALDGFMKNQFFVLVNDMQLESLDSMIELKKVDNVSFIKLVPLIGG